MIDKWHTSEDYINSFDAHTKEKLLQIKNIILSVLGECEEGISYNIPAFKKEWVWTFYYSAYTKHISLSFFPTTETYKLFEKELSDYKHSKSAIQFPLDKELPEKLIRAIITDALPRIIKARSKKK